MFRLILYNYYSVVYRVSDVCVPVVPTQHCQSSTPTNLFSESFDFVYDAVLQVSYINSGQIYYRTLLVMLG